MDLVYSFGLMGEVIKDIMNQIKNMDMVFIAEKII